MTTETLVAVYATPEAPLLARVVDTERTPLAAVVTANKTAPGRLGFLRGLVDHPEAEPRTLHAIVDGEDVAIY